MLLFSNIYGHTSSFRSGKVKRLMAYEAHLLKGDQLLPGFQLFLFPGIETILKHDVQVLSVPQRHSLIY